MWELQGRALSFLNYLEPKVFVKETDEERESMHAWTISDNVFSGDMLVDLAEEPIYKH
jgi:hypothetical protein